VGDGFFICEKASVADPRSSTGGKRLTNVKGLISYAKRLLGAANTGSFQRPPGGELVVTKRMMDGSGQLS
jgi:hypothetical protein